MGNYFLSVICAAILCAVIGNLAEQKGASGVVLKLISGIFLVFTVIKPVAVVELEELAIFTSDLQAEAQSTAAMGEEMSQDFIASIIKAETEAYILDKAATMELEVTVEVTVGEDMIPDSVRIEGAVPPYGKARLQSIIESDLAISKERQLWSE